MAVVAKVNKNRYKLITLLYLLSVCLSIINIPTSLLDSSIYTFNYLVSKEKESMNISANLTNLIHDNDSAIKYKDTAIQYVKLATEINELYKKLLFVDKLFETKLKQKNSTAYIEVANTNIFESVLKGSDTLALALESQFIQFSNSVEKNPFKLSSNFIKEIPTGRIIKSHSGKDVLWHYYLFGHKPAIIVYVQLKRIMVQLLEERNKYLLAALQKIGINQEMFDKNKFKEKIKLEVIQEIVDQKELQEKELQEQQQKQDQQEPQPEQVIQKKIKQSLISDEEIIEPNKKASTQVKKEDFDDFFQKLFIALHTEYFYVGIQNKILNNFQYEINKDFKIEIMPFAAISRIDNTYSCYFTKADKYTIKFYDIRNNNIKLLFVKNVIATLLPQPFVKLRTSIVERNGVSKLDLIISNGLTATGNIPGLDFFPGKITSYQVTKINVKNERVSVNNLGDIFQHNTKELIRSSEKGDLILFSNIFVNMLDGTSHVVNTMAYKIN